ncbi:MAG: hypothetical protein AABW49_02570 [Nanoarchaeota archaeon]
MLSKIPKYTKIGGKADEYIHELVSKIVDEIRIRIPNVISIILMGGFGRGEGIVEKKNNSFRPINDFDFYIITNKVLDDEFLEKTAREISHKLGFGGVAHAEGFEKKRYNFRDYFHIDIRCLEERKLKNLPPLIRYYEMKKCGLVVYGKNSLKNFPDITTKDLTLSDGLRAFMNRMMLMLISIKPEWIKNNSKMSEEEVMVLHYYLAKGLFTCVENLLLISGDFEPTYWGRAEKFQKIYSRKFPEVAKKYPKLPQLVNEYLDYKKTMKIPKKDSIDAWFEVQDVMRYLFRVSLSFLTKKRAPENILEQYYFMKKELAYPYFKPYASFILKRYYMDNELFNWLLSRAAMSYLSLKYSYRMNYLHKTSKFKYVGLNDPGMRILAIMPLIFFGINKDGSHDTRLTNLAMKELKKVYSVKKVRTWEEAKTQYLIAQRSYFLMRFV